MKSKLQNEIKQVLDDIRGQTSELDSGNIPIPPDAMCRFLIAGEDHRFKFHPGVDPIAIGRSIWKNLFSGANQGGSTIAMQLVRTYPKVQIFTVEDYFAGLRPDISATLKRAKRMKKSNQRQEKLDFEK